MRLHAGQLHQKPGQRVLAQGVAHGAEQHALVVRHMAGYDPPAAAFVDGLVKAEPAVYVLMEKVEEITDGSISGRSLQISLSIGMAVSIGMAMIRVLTGLNIMWFLIPGYFISLLMAFMTPKIFTAIAFDSGGVASGPMTATFLLPLSTLRRKYSLSS